MKSVINLVQTSQGYSIVEGNVEVNKATSKASKDKSQSQTKKYVQQTYTIYPYIPSKEADNHKYILLPARSLWFNLNLVHEIQKKALPEWFKIKKGILATMSNIKFEKHEELYKKYRNYIIELGKEKYITPTQSRRGLAGDACAIIRIHKFLERWGLINYIHLKPGSKVELINSNNTSEGETIQRKDCFEKDKAMASRSYSKDDLQLLKKITKTFRPLCHFCQGICGILWFQYSESLTLKEIVSIPEKLGKVLAPTDQTAEYNLVVCSSCFHEGSYPLILSPQDFTKKSVLDFIEEVEEVTNDKKRNNQQNKVAESIQKNRFKLKKTAEQLKMTKQNVFRLLMTMPIQKLEKISRIQAETEAQTEEASRKIEVSQEKQKKEGLEKREEITEESLVQKFTKQVDNLEDEYREAYQQFIQSWLLKINAKLERLKEWEDGVKTKFGGIVRMQKNQLASKVRTLWKKCDE